MKKVILSLFLIIASVFMVGAPVGAISASPSDAVQGDVSAAGCDDKLFFGMRPWYYGLTKNGCDISETNFKGEANLKDTIFKIILNVIHDIMIVIGVIATGFLMFGAYQYIRSGGSSVVTAKGKKTIATAIIGLVIALLSEVIVNTIGKALMSASSGSASYGLYNIETDQLIQTMVSFVLGALTLAAVGFAIGSGVQMITAGGDPTRLQQGKNGLVTSIVGIVIAMLGFAVINFVTTNVGASMEGNDADAFETVQTIFGIVIGVVGLVAVGGVVYGGIQYMTSASDPNKATKAKNAIIWSLVGMVIAVIGGAVIEFVIGSLVSDTGDDTTVILDE